MNALKATTPAREVRQGDIIESSPLSGQVIRVRHAKIGSTPITMITVSVDSVGVTRGFYAEETVEVILEDDGR